MSRDAAAEPAALPERPTHRRDTEVRHDRIDTTGCVTFRHRSRLHHIGIGRSQRRPVSLNPSRDYQARSSDAVGGWTRLAAKATVTCGATRTNDCAYADSWLVLA